MKIAINIVVLLTIFATIFYFSNRKTNKILAELQEKFPSISKNDKIDGKISLIYNGDPNIFRNSLSHAYLIIDDSLYRSVNTDYEMNTRQTFEDVIELGARFVKDSNEVFIKILKSNDSTYIFELLDNRGYPLKNEKD